MSNYGLRGGVDLGKYIMLNLFNSIKVFLYCAFVLVIYLEFLTAEPIQRINEVEGSQKIAFTLSKEIIFLTISIAISEVISNIIEMSSRKLKH